jgi:diguanylate cyclase (GGDEF)-like protein/PAS domain S-box-containing protein
MDSEQEPGEAPNQSELDQSVTSPGLISFARPPRAIAGHVLLSISFLLLYILLNRPEIIFISRLGSVAWYPANGLVLALMLGINPWYALLVCFSDALAGFLFYHQPVWSFGETIGAVSVAAVYGTAAYILRGPLRIDFRLRRGRDVVRYLCVTMAAALLATLVGVLCLVADRSITWHDFPATSVGWFIGDCIGLLGLAPALLIHVVPWVRRQLLMDTSDPQSRRERRVKDFEARGWTRLEGVGQALSIAAVLWIMFGPRWANLELFYLSFIPILWMAMRGGIRLVTSGMLALNFGIVVTLHLFPPQPDLLTRIGLLMLVVSATGLVVGSTITERQYMGFELHEQTTYLNALLENSPLGIVVLRTNGRIDLVNDAFSTLSLYRRSELVGGKLDSLFLRDETSEGNASWSTDLLAGQHLQRTVHLRRRDKTVVSLELNAVPLVIDGRVEGAYAICKDISEQLRASAAEKANAVALNRLVQELELQRSQMVLLNEMAGLLECCATTKEACTVVGEFARKFFPEARSGTLFTFKASRNLVEAAAFWGDAAALEPVFAPQSCWALRRGQPHWSDISAKGISCPHLSGAPQHKFLCLPMVGQGETLGVLQVEFLALANELPDANDVKQRLGMTVASQIALSLGSLQLRETLRDQSIRDPLTGLFNRRFMQESLEREMMRARRKRHSISLLYIDIDHFKRFNDTFGHDAGDFVLRSVADTLRGFFRGDDVTCRCGGEEFAVILPESLLTHAALRAEDLRKEMKKLKLHYRERTLDPISISVGVAVFPDHGQTSEELLKIADQCLYESKAGGRDRVTVAALNS